MPCGAVPSYSPSPAKFRKQKELPVVESQHWHRPPAREQCPNVSMHCSPAQPAHPNMDRRCSGANALFFFPLYNLPLHPASTLSYGGEGARTVFWGENRGICIVLNYKSRGFDIVQVGCSNLTDIMAAAAFKQPT